MLERIQRTVGVSNIEELSSCVFGQFAKNIFEVMNKLKHKSLRKMITKAPKEAIDLLNNLL